MRSIIIIGLSVLLVIAAVFSVDAGLYASYFLFGLSIVLAVGLSFLNTIKSPGEIKKALFAVIGIIALFVISYVLSSEDVTAVQAAKGVTVGTSKLVGAGLIMFYLISAIAIGGLIFSEVNKAFK